MTNTKEMDYVYSESVDDRNGHSVYKTLDGIMFMVTFVFEVGYNYDNKYPVDAKLQYRGVATWVSSHNYDDDSDDDFERTYDDDDDVDAEWDWDTLEPS